MKIFTLSNILIAFRLIISPLMLPVLLVYFLGYNSFFINACLALLFIVLSFADFFYGYLLNWFKLEPKVSKLLNPISDSFFSYSTLIALLAANKIFFYWVIILIGRDFFVMGIRSIACENKFSISVVFLDKVKTFLQLGFLAFVILNPYQSLGFTNKWNLAENGLLFIVLALSIYSAKIYYNSFYKQFLVLNPEESTETIEPTFGSDTNQDRDW